MKSEDEIEITIQLEEGKPPHPGADTTWRISHVQLKQSDEAPPSQKPGENHHQLQSRIVLYRNETPAYLYNLASPEPSLFIVVRSDDNNPRIHLATLSPYEAQDYMDGDDEQVERWPVSANLKTWLEKFIEKHHQETEFKKRRRDQLDLEKQQFGKTPIFLNKKQRLQEE